MNSAASYPSQVTPSPVRLVLRGQGHVPSFKNGKMILWSQRRTMTKPEVQKWMTRAVESFASQLRCALATNATGTTTAPIPLSLIASSLPLDDSRKWIPEHCVKTQLVARGEEGADILIERVRVEPHPKPRKHR